MKFGLWVKFGLSLTWNLSF